EDVLIPPQPKWGGTGATATPLKQGSGLTEPFSMCRTIAVSRRSESGSLPPLALLRRVCTLRRGPVNGLDLLTVSSSCIDPKRRCGASVCSCRKFVMPAHDQEQIAWGHTIELGGEMRGENSHLVLAEPGSD